MSTNGTPTRGRRTAGEIVRDLLSCPGGRISLSVYETARVAALAPNAIGQDARIRFLLTQQRPDGMWGGPGHYALVPTLSAVDALLAAGTAPGAVLAGIAALRAWRHCGHDALPDTVAVELIVPALTDSVNRHLEPHQRISFAHVDPVPLDRLRRQLASGAAVPEKLTHTLEVVPDLAPGLPTVRLVDGLVCASPAATAAWLGGRTCAEFDAVLEHYGGPVPAFHPITNFERAWVVSWLHGTGVDVRRVPLVDPSAGVPTAPALPVDADTTAATLWGLSLQGRSHVPDALWQFEQDGHFTTWTDGERTLSPTTNAHVLEALGVHRNRSTRIDQTIDEVGCWLLDVQGDDGSWRDKWHASPYYATCCCALALRRFGGLAATRALEAAVEWILRTQRPDGGWGVWGSTVEETAYAVHVLVRAVPGELDGPGGARIQRALDRAQDVLADEHSDGDHPPLWHDKDLYVPHNVVDAVIAAARHRLADACLT